MNILKFIITNDNAVDSIGIPQQCGNDVRLKINKMFPLTNLIWQNQTQESHDSMTGQMAVQQVQPPAPT